MRLVGLIGVALALQTQTCVAIHQPAPPAPTIRPGLYLTRLVPPAWYRQVYLNAVRCSGGRGDYDKIEWLSVPAPWLQGQHQTLGSWEALPDGRARIVLNALQLGDSALVAHESLHDILWRSGWSEAPYNANATWDDSVQVNHPSPPYGHCAPTYGRLPVK